MNAESDSNQENLIPVQGGRMWDASTSNFRIIDTQMHYSTAASSELFLAIFHKETQAAALTHMLTHLDTMARNNKGVVNLLNVVRPGSPMPDEAARHALIQVFRYIADQGASAQSAVVFEGSGAAASIIRSVVTGLSLVSKTMLPIKVFATVEDAATWLQPKLTALSNCDASQVNAVIAEMDRRHKLKFERRST